MVGPSVDKTLLLIDLQYKKGYLFILEKKSQLCEIESCIYFLIGISVGMVQVKNEGVII